MYLFKELDKWAYDIEQEIEKTNIITPRTRRKHFNICKVRDRLWKQHVEYIQEANKQNSRIISFPGLKFCQERLKPKREVD